MATAEAITRALARLRADRPGLGLEESIDEHWTGWFGRPEFRDSDLIEAVNWYLRDTPARTWPTVAEIETAIKKVGIFLQEREQEGEPCFWECMNGLVYKTIERPYKHTALVPCECPKGQAKTAALQAAPTGNRFALGREQEEGP